MASKKLLNLLCLAGFLATGAALTSPALGAEEDFLGKWNFAVDHRPAVRYGTLEIVRSDDGIEGYIDNGPVEEVSIEGDRIAFPFDWEDGGGLHFVDQLEGTLSDGRIEGVMRRDGEQTGTWWATPREGIPGVGEDPDPVDLSGIWNMQTYDGTAKLTFDMTEKAKAFQAGFDPKLGDPALRCVSDGLVRVTGGPFAMEIIDQGDRILVLHEDMHETRFIYMDGRDFPEDVEYMYSPMGYSIGHWEGSTLVVETRGLKDSIWHRTGTPISSQARITEYIYTGDDGNLYIDLVLDDPENYNRPPMRHTVWENQPDYEFTYYDCDPHPFYRGIYMDGRFEEYLN